MSHSSHQYTLLTGHMLLIRIPVCLLIVWLAFSISGTAQPTPLPQAHAHNDYEHERPLLDALSHGFTSVEADVLLIDGELYVGHDMPRGPHQLPTLREAYLQPLQERTREQGGQVYAGYDGPFYLMIDIKTEANATYGRLKQELAAYQSLLSYARGDQYRRGAVTVFLSGNRPLEMLRQENLRLAGIDGRPEDLGRGYDSTLMPVISQNYQLILDWNGEDAISPQQKQTLEQLTTQAHREGKKVRLWASPESPQVWKTLLEAGVDLINTDRLAALQQFLNQQDE